MEESVQHHSWDQKKRKKPGMSSVEVQKKVEVWLHMFITLLIGALDKWSCPWYSQDISTVRHLCEWFYVILVWNWIFYPSGTQKMRMILLYINLRLSKLFLRKINTLKSLLFVVRVSTQLVANHSVRNKDFK